MLHLNDIRNNKEKYIRLLKIRGVDFSDIILSVIEKDDERKEIQKELDQILALANQNSKKIGEFFKKGMITEANELKKKSIDLKNKSKQLQNNKNQVEEHIKDAINKGAKAQCGGKRHSIGGTFFEPTILTDVDKSMLIAEEETFGPVAPLFRFKDEDDVIEQANNTIFGLASYFYASDLKRVWKVAEALEYGMVGINTGLISTEVAPFGGVKQSGLGREGSHHGIDEYLELKYLCLSL